MSKGGDKDASGELVNNTNIDITDYRIIALLRKNGLMTNRELATTLKKTEATIRTRLQRLEANNTMRVVAMTDFRAAGYNLMTSVGIQVKGRATSDVANDIAKLSQVLNVQIVIGTTDIEISAGAQDTDALAQLMAILGKVPGVHRLFPGMALEVVKFQWGWVPYL